MKPGQQWKRLFAWIGVAGIAFLAPGVSALLPSRAAVRMSLQISQAANPEAELQTGIALSQQGYFTEAIPHFLAARGRVRDEYAADFNLALCYVATGQPNRAIELLNALKNRGSATAGVNNLLAQAYIATGQEKEALGSFEQAVAQTPDDEKLYLFLADACLDHQSYDLGLQILRMGAQHVPRSALLRYQRGIFLTFENQPDSAEKEFHIAEKLAPKSDTYYMAAGQAALLEGGIPEAIRVTREGIHAGYQNYILLALFGSAVADSGASPPQPLFAEAEAALDKSIAKHPANADARVALAKLYLAANRVDDAIEQLETARKLAPANPSVYSHLAVAYRRTGDLGKAHEMLAVLAKLDAAQAARYKTDSPNKAGYFASGRTPRNPSQEPPPQEP